MEWTKNILDIASTRARAHTLAGLTCLLALAPGTTRANDAAEFAAQTEDLKADVQKGRSPRPAELNAFGCRGVGGAVFAGRYQAIDVFADINAVVAGDNVPARVYGRLAAGLLPEMLSAAFVEWKLKLNDNDMLVMNGNTLRPDGSALAVRLKMRFVRGVQVTATITTNVATTGESTSESILCTVR